MSANKKKTPKPKKTVKKLEQFAINREQQETSNHELSLQEQIYQLKEDIGYLGDLLERLDDKLQHLYDETGII